MSRYLIFGSIFLVIVFGIFLMMPSSSPIEDVEDVKQLIKEEKSLHKTSGSVAIEYESDSSSLSSSSLSSSSSNSSSSLSTKNKSESEVIEKLIGEKNLEPLYKEWKQKGDLSYNVYIEKSPESEGADQKLAPPAMPSFTTVEVSGEKITVVIPGGTKGYIVTKEDGEINYQLIESSNLKPIALPGVGN